MVTSGFQLIYNYSKYQAVVSMIQYLTGIFRSYIA